LEKEITESVLKNNQLKKHSKTGVAKISNTDYATPEDLCIKRLVSCQERVF